MTDAAIDVSTLVCPMTFVRTRLALDRLAPGQTLGVTLREGEAARNVAAAAAALGCVVTSQESVGAHCVQLVIRK